jgi:uncharacterized delta-60 repeat protein
MSVFTFMGGGKAVSLAVLLVLAAGSAQGAPVTTTFGPRTDDEADALAIQPDGKIVVAGYTTTGGDDSEFALARYTVNGTLDRAFGTGGKVTTAFGSAGAKAVALQPDGKIVAAGQVLVNRPDFDFALARFDANGALDQTFGSGGKVTTTFGSTADFVDAVALQPDGRIVAAGSTGTSQQRDDVFALTRYTPDGTLDSSFGDGGTTGFVTQSQNLAQSVLVQPDGKIVVAGDSLVYSRPGPSDFALARYNADGTLDESFGSGGKVTTTFGSASSPTSRARSSSRPARIDGCRRENRRVDPPVNSHLDGGRVEGRSVDRT